jgi:hypothetical protein
MAGSGLGLLQAAMKLERLGVSVGFGAAIVENVGWIMAAIVEEGGWILLLQ